MTWLSTKELYGLFLESDFWINLSRLKRGLTKKCERCSSTQYLQSHHRFYRDHWFDTKLDDLECLCRRCHQNEHGIGIPKTKPIELPVTDESITLKQLNRLRSAKRISRERFLSLREKILKQRPRKRSKKKRRNKPSPEIISSRVQKAMRAIWRAKKIRHGWI